MYATNVAILTGAGASIPLNIPGMKGMARKFREDMAYSAYADTYHLLNDVTPSEDVEEILELANAVESFSEDSVRSIVEQCVSPTGSSDALDKFTDRLQESAQEIEDFRHRMYDWMTETCWAFDRDRANTIYRNLVKLASEKQIPIFTTNYDTVLDYVAEEQGISICDNFYQGDRDREYWDDTLNSFHEKGLRLIKIHGSVQWHINPAGTIEKINAKASHNREGEPLERLLIFPTRFKDIYQRNYFPLYSAFTRTLGNAEVLIVIGHSLRDDYLRAAIREQLRRGRLSLIFVGPDFVAEDELLAGVRTQRERNVTHLNRKIQDVYPLLCQTLSDVSPNEMQSHVDQASEALSRGRKEKIDVDGLKVYVTQGETVEFELKLETIVGGGAVDLYAYANSKQPGIPLDLKPLNGEWPSLNGRQSLRLPVKTTVPSRDADSYLLKFILRDHTGERADLKTRKFRIKNE